MSEATCDVDPPVLSDYRVNEDRGYVLPGETLAFEVDADDGVFGSGIDALKASFDGGSTWTGWATLDDGLTADLSHPGVYGRVVMSVVVRDGESTPLTSPITLVRPGSRASARRVRLAEARPLPDRRESGDDH